MNLLKEHGNIAIFHNGRKGKIIVHKSTNTVEIKLENSNRTIPVTPGGKHKTDVQTKNYWVKKVISKEKNPEYFL